MPLGPLIIGDFAITIDALPSICAGFVEGARLRAPRAGDVIVFDGGDALTEAAPMWRALERAGGAATAFQSLALAQAAASAHRAQGDRLRIAIVMEGERPVLLLPTVVGRIAGVPTLRFLGDPLIQYGDAIASRAARPEHFDAALNALADGAGASLAVLRKVRGDARIAATLEQRAARVREEAAPFVDLAYAGSRSGREEQKLRRWRRRLAEHGPIEFTVVRGCNAASPLREALDLKRAWLNDRGLRSRVIGHDAWERAVASLVHEAPAKLAAARLSVGGRTAAIEIGLAAGRHWYSFLGATAPGFAKAGPGHVQIAETIEQCRRDGLATYDLLAPGQDYKHMHATGSVAVRDYAIPLDLRGRGALWAARLLLRTTSSSGFLSARLRSLRSRIAPF